MSVSAGEFKSWLERAGVSSSPSKLSGLTGLNRQTIRNQIVRGNVAESTIVEVARALGLNVVSALTQFDPYSDLTSRPLMPTQAEVISQVHHADLMAELQFRTSQERFPRSARNDFPLIDFPHDGSLRAWVDSLGEEDIRKTVSEATGAAQTYLASLLSENKLSPPLSVAFARAGSGPLTSGLVVTGIINPSEGGWPVRAREEALLEISDENLVDVLAQRIHLLQRRLKQRSEAEQYARRMTELLG